MRSRLFYLAVILFLTSLINDSLAEIRDTIPLAGDWNYYIHKAPSQVPAQGKIQLPSTLDYSRKSIYNEESDNTTQMRREFSFSGDVAYSRRVNIPDSWKGKNIELFLERTKPSSLYIDGAFVGYNSRISSPQRYDVSKLLTPGSHKIELIVNNSDSLPPIVSRSSHAAAESTQTNWNGILGDIHLEAKNPFFIKKITLSEDLDNKSLIALINFSHKSNAQYMLEAEIQSHKPSYVKINKDASSAIMIIPLPEDVSLWSAQNPELIDISFTLSEQGEIIDKYSLTTGIRDFQAKDDYFHINNRPIFLRGTVNAAVFPFTAFAPTDTKSWIEYFSTLKDYGLNHVRFHSWTPPEAAFIAADQLGFYIQTELPMWGELDNDLVFTNKFLNEELTGIMESYASHPSFVMFSVGNELWGDISLMGDYMKRAKDFNPRILSTYGSNIYLGMNGQIGEEDFIVAAKTNDDIHNSIRGSVSFADSPTGGYFNSTLPNSFDNFSKATEGISIPIVAHEVGQYQSYPDFSEIDLYSGVLKADNLKEFRRMAEQAGTLRKNKDFVEASGKLAVRLYKAEMEMAQRSNGIAGYQLFGIQDYPGQGTALVGILNPLMESKGFISPEDWKESCGDLEILAEFPKFTFYENESIEIPIISVNFTDSKNPIGNIYWNTGFQKGVIETLPGSGVIENEAIFLNMPKISKPQKHSLFLSSENGEVSNSYDFWVYPTNHKNISNVQVTDNLSQALELLNKGERVILCPDTATTRDASIAPLFVNDFWNYRMYRTICDEMNLTPSPGTLGLLIDNRHPALNSFVTDNHTDWQWFSIMSISRPLVIDRLPKDFDAIVEVIDNVERNFRLALMLECNVGKGKLMILSADLHNLQQTPEGKWLLQSIKEYMAGKECKPDITLSPDQLVNLLTKPSYARKVKELKNETYNSRWD